MVRFWIWSLQFWKRGCASDDDGFFVAKKIVQINVTQVKRSFPPSPSEEIASSISLAVQTTAQLTTNTAACHGAVCWLNRGNSGCSICA